MSVVHGVFITLGILAAVAIPVLILVRPSGEGK